MKMKKNIFIVVLSFFILSSCEEDKSLNPRPVIVDGNFVRLDITRQHFIYEDINNTDFGGDLTTPGNNVAQYDLFVRRRNPFGVLSEYKHLTTITTFPTNLSITPQMVADALGMQLSELEVGDNYHFRGVATGFDGTVTDFNSLSATVRGLPSYKQAFLFKTDLELNQEVFVPNDNGNYF
jgi:hypothetical protein